MLPVWLVVSAELETNNVPQTLAELNKWYVEPPTNENGAVYFLQAAQILETNLDHYNYTDPGGDVDIIIEWPMKEMPAGNEPLAKTEKAAMASFLKRIKPAWPLLERGAKCAQSRYPIDLNEGAFTEVLNLNEVSQDAFACQFAALANADAKRENEAGESILLGLAVARSLEPEPLRISQATRGRFLVAMVDGAEQVMNRTSLSDTMLDRLQTAFDNLVEGETEGENFTRAWVSERLIDLSYFDMSSNRLSKWASKWIPWQTNYTLAQIPQLVSKGIETRPADRKYYAETYNQVLSIWRQGYPKRFEIDSYLTSRMAELAKTQFEFEGDYTNTVKREGAVIAHLRLAKTAIALERYRAAHENVYPESLSSLVPRYLSAIPHDIFTDSPLHYERRANGYLLSCSGPDWGNNGDLLKDHIVFQVVNPPGRAIIK